MKLMLRKTAAANAKFGERPETKLLESKSAEYLKDEIQSKSQELESLKKENGIARWKRTHVFWYISNK